MKKNIFFALTLLTSQSLYSINFRTPLYVGKEALKTICDGAIAYNVIALGYRLEPGHCYDAAMLDDVFTRSAGSSILIIAGIRTGIYIIENNLVAYYSQFQEWRTKKQKAPSV